MTNISSYHSPQGRFLAYLRASTWRQGEGVSLLTQRDTIAAFAARKHLLVTGWSEKKETAAKRGRPCLPRDLEASPGFKYSRRLRYVTCGKCLVGSLAKGRVYYRCQTVTCPTTSIREDRVAPMSLAIPSST